MQSGSNISKVAATCYYRVPNVLRRRLTLKGKLVLGGR